MRGTRGAPRTEEPWEQQCPQWRQQGLPPITGNTCGTTLDREGREEEEEEEGDGCADGQTKLKV